MSGISTRRARKLRRLITEAKADIAASYTPDFQRKRANALSRYDPVWGNYAYFRTWNMEYARLKGRNS